MRFSLRSLLVASVVIGLLVATIMAHVETGRYQDRIDEIFRTYGEVVTDGETDHFELIDLLLDDKNRPNGPVCYLFRVENSRHYDLEFIFFDGATGERTTKRVPLLGPEYSLTYTESGDQSRFYVGPTIYGLHRRQEGAEEFQFARRGTAKFSSQRHSGQLRKTQFLYCMFVRSDTPRVDRLYPRYVLNPSIKNIEAAAQEHQLQVVMFRLVEREVASAVTGSVGQTVRQ